MVYNVQYLFKQKIIMEEQLKIVTSINEIYYEFIKIQTTH